MKSQPIQYVLAIFGIVLVSIFSAQAAQASRIALVIGNSAYRSAALKNPANDAADMARALEKLGFSVEVEINVNQREMEEAMRRFGHRLRNGATGLFYFAGHGMQLKGRNYIIPIGAAITAEPDVKYEAVDAGRVLSYMEDAGNPLNIVILDACRDNPFARSFRSYSRGLAKMDAPVGSILAYATAPGDVAADGNGRNGVYTAALLQHLRTPGLKIEEVFKRVRIDVVRASTRKQIPWESSSLMGDFYFNPVNERISPSPSVSGVRPKTPEASKSVASPSPTSEGEVVAREGRFLKMSNGTVKDSQSKLVWAGGDSNMALTWEGARSYCADYRSGGHSD